MPKLLVRCSAAAIAAGCLSLASVGHAQIAAPPQEGGGAGGQPAEPNASTTTASPNGEEQGGLEEIVVTAERRSERLQDVPLAITAQSGAELQRSGVQTTNDLQFSTPSLVVTTNGAFGQPFLRGVGTDILGVGTDSSVAINIDGVYIARATSAIQDFYDVERVEVVKGPQGILYGRNATGGAINILTKQPSEEFGGFFALTYGNYDKVRTEGALNVPLGEGAATRFSFFRSTRDGFTKNVLDPNRSRQVDDENTYGGRLQLLLQPGSRWKITLAADYFEQDDSAFLAGRPTPRRDYLAAGIPLNDFFVNPATGAMSPTAQPGFLRRAGAISRTPAESFGGILFDNVRRSNQDIDVFNAVRDYGFRATVAYEGDSVTVRSITAYRVNDYLAVQDFDNTNAQYFYDREGSKSKVFTQELQLASANDGPFEWILGGYYLREKGSSFFDYFIGAAVVGAPGDYVQLGGPAARLTTDALAAFGQLTYELATDLSATAGLRYSYEKKHDFRLVDPLTPTAPACDPRPVPAAEKRCSESWSTLTPKFGLEYRFAPNRLLYASATRGFKSGGFNSNGGGEVFNPEYIWSYEAGLKADWFNRTLRTNAAVFYYDYKNLQVRLRDPVLGATGVVSNAAKARVFGAEVDIQLAPVEGLTLDFSAAYLNAEFRDYRTANADDDATVALNLAGNRLPRAPEWTLSSGFNYVAPVASGDVTVSGEWRYSSRIFFDVFNQPFVEQPGFNLFNARVQYNNEEHDFYVGLFARNITNKTYRTSIIRADGVIGTLNFFGAPRTYGIQIGKNF